MSGEDRTLTEWAPLCVDLQCAYVTPEPSGEVALLFYWPVRGETPGPPCRAGAES